MSDFLPIQQSFIGGVISPRLSGMTEAPRYGFGLQTCDNFQITPQGSLRLRQGSKYLRDSNTVNSKLFNFSRVNRADAMLEVSQNKVNLIGSEGVLFEQDLANANFVRDANFNQGLAVWNYSNDYTQVNYDKIVDGRTYGSWVLNTAEEIAYRMPEESDLRPQFTAGNSVRFGCYFEERYYDLSRVNYIGFINPDADTCSCEITDHKLKQEVTVLDGSQSHVFKCDIFQSFAGNQLNDWLSTSPNFNPRVDVRCAIINPSNNSVIKSETVSFGKYFNNGFKYPINFNFTPATRTFLLEISVKSYDTQGYYGLGLLDFSIEVENIEIKSTAATTEYTTFDSPYSGFDLNLIQVAVDTGSRRMILTHPDVVPYSLTETVDGVFSFEPFFSGSQTDPFFNWGEGNYPLACVFFQGRLWLAGARRDPSILYASSSGEYTEFDIDATDSNALRFELQTNGAIQWLRGTKTLLIGTDNSEWIASSSSGVITEDDFKFVEQSRLGSKATVAPQYAGDQIIYAGLDSRRVRATNLDINLVDNWIANELSLQAEHLLSTRVVDMAYARDPDYQLAVVTGAGELAVCMNDRVQDLNAWYVYKTEGYFRCVEYTNHPEGNKLWVVVERAGGNYIEQLNVDKESNVHLDSHLVRNIEYKGDENGVGGFSSAFNSGFDGQGKDVRHITGAGHFEQESIQCVISVNSEDFNTKSYQSFIGNVYIYLGNGKIPYRSGMYKAFLGRSYVAEAKTWPAEIPSQRGTTQGSKHHMSRIFSRCINDSAYPILNGYRPVAENPKENILDSTVTGDIGKSTGV